jgi:hypothetical protein
MYVRLVVDWIEDNICVPKGKKDFNIKASVSLYVKMEMCSVGEARFVNRDEATIYDADVAERIVVEWKKYKRVFQGISCKNVRIEIMGA